MQNVETLPPLVIDGEHIESYFVQKKSEKGLVFIEAKLEVRSSAALLNHLATHIGNGQDKVRDWIQNLCCPLRLLIGKVEALEFKNRTNSIPNRNNTPNEETVNQATILAGWHDVTQHIATQLNDHTSKLSQLLQKIEVMERTNLEAHIRSANMDPKKEYPSTDPDKANIRTWRFLSGLHELLNLDDRKKLIDIQDNITRDVPHLEQYWREQDEPTVILWNEEQYMHRRAGQIPHKQVLFHMDRPFGLMGLCRFEKHKHARRFFLSDYLA